MRTLIRTTGLFLLAVALGVLLAPKAYILAQQAGDAFHEQARAVLTQAQTLIAGASPGIAAHLATILMIAAASAGMMLVYLVVSVPFRLSSMRRQIGQQIEEIDLLREELRESRGLLAEARREFQMARERMMPPSSEAAPPLSPRVDRFIFPQGVPEAPASGPRDA